MWHHHDPSSVAGFLRLTTITVLLQRAGVGRAVSAHLPDSLRGLHSGTGSGGYLLQHQAAAWPGTQAHTIRYVIPLPGDSRIPDRDATAAACSELRGAPHWRGKG